MDLPGVIARTETLPATKRVTEEPGFPS